MISRPRYQDLAAATSLNDITLDGGGGNPNLKPYESVNYELTAEWYPRSGTLLAVELFRRDIKNYVIAFRQNVDYFNALQNRITTYNVSQPINGAKATVNGVLVSGQAEIWGGFGLQANYSYQDSSTSSVDVTGTTLNLPYLSKHTVNVIPYFEKGHSRLASATTTAPLISARSAASARARWWRRIISSTRPPPSTCWTASCSA